MNVESDMTRSLTSNSWTLSLIVPCFNEEAALHTFFRRIRPILDGLGCDWEIVCVDDGSVDQTKEILQEYCSTESRIKVLFFSRNFGKEAALTAGLEHMTGDVCIPIDVDLQDPPEMIPELITKWQEGYDVVYAVRKSRPKDTWLKKTTAAAFYRIYNKLAAAPVPANAGDFRALDKRVVEALRLLGERNRFMKGLFSWPGFRQCAVHYDRNERLEGASKFNYWKLWNFAIDGITSFSTVPLRLWTYVGAAIAFSSFVYAGFLIVRTIIYGTDVPGYASIMVVMLMLGGIQLITLGVIGEYLGRTYDEVKRRPLYIVESAINLKKQS